MSTEELPYGGTTKDLREQIARQAIAAEAVFREASGQPVPWSKGNVSLNEMAACAMLHGWTVVSLLGWIEEEIGSIAADRAASMVQDMGENGGAYFLDGLDIRPRP